MDFWLSDDLLAIQDGIASFLDGRLPVDRVAATEGSAAVIDPDGWRELADLGVFSMLDDGLDMRAAAVGFEELGRALTPGPLAATFAAAEVIPGASTGDRIVGLFEPDDRRAIVEHPGQVDDLLWFTDGGLGLVDPAALDLVVLARCLDPLSPAATTRTVNPASTPVASGGQADLIRYRAVLLLAAQAVGVAGAATDLANAYAKQREQFGRAIGSFQAVKHLLAEMFTKTEVARAAVHAAACALDDASDQPAARAVSVAKIMAGDAALFCTKTGIQVHGGMGFTWEVHAQRFWKRAVVLDATLGTGDHHAQSVAATLIDQATNHTGE